MTSRKYSYYDLTVTTQGPTYPPSEVMDKNGNFIVIGILNLSDSNNELYQKWGAAIVDKKSVLPKFGENAPYMILKFLDLSNVKEMDMDLYTLPLPLPCNNYPMIFAPDQVAEPLLVRRKSLPFHLAYIPDLRPMDGRKLSHPITLGQWIKAQGRLKVLISNDLRSATFSFDFHNLIPNSLYTVMALREHDLDPLHLSRPSPLGVPNVFITDKSGDANYEAIMPNPFSIEKEYEKRNRIINVIVLWMSSQMSYGGAIGHYGLGGDIHAQLKLKTKSFMELQTID